MNGWRAAYAVGLLVFVALPLLKPFAEIVRPASWVWTTDDGARLFQLGLNTLSLTAGTLALSLPLGFSLSVLLFRTTFIARRFLMLLLALALFVPLPVIVSSWQGFFGSDGWLPVDLLRSDIDRPWTTGMTAAIWIHTLAAVPWVAFIVGIGLTWVEPELEDEAAQIVGPWRVLAFVTLPRGRTSILAAALFVVLQTAAETSVTEMMLVPTLAEETRTQFAAGDDAGLARTLIVALPGLLLIWAAVLGLISYLEKNLAPLAPASRSPRALQLGHRWSRLLIAAGVLVLVLIPLTSLAWKLGLAGHPQQWSSAVAWHYLESETRVYGRKLIQTLALTLGAGCLTAALAVLGCWLARDSPWFRRLLFSAVIWAWIVPAPVVGIGLHDTIWLLPAGPWQGILLHGPSPLPMIWVQVMRALPIAVVFLWPIVRLIPRELFEEARLHGAGPVSEWLHVVAPLTWRACLVTALACTALCLGEVSASARVETPGWESFTKLLLDHMHRGVDNTVAALCVLLLGSLAALAAMGVALVTTMRAISYR